MNFSKSILCFLALTISGITTGFAKDSKKEEVCLERQVLSAPEDEEKLLGLPTKFCLESMVVEFVPFSASSKVLIEGDVFRGEYSIYKKSESETTYRVHIPYLYSRQQIDPPGPIESRTVLMEMEFDVSKSGRVENLLSVTAKALMSETTDIYHGRDVQRVIPYALSHQ